MCEVVTKIIVDGKSYLLPTLPEYEPPRVREFQECLMPMIEYLSGRFERGTISIWWDDDKEFGQMRMNTSEEIELQHAIQAWNDFKDSLPCLVELRSKT